MGRRLLFAFAFYLVTCHSLILGPNSVRNDKNFHVNNPPMESVHGNSKIIGGEPTDIEKYPYVVSLQQNGTFFGHDFEHFCVGNIVSKKWILTAAKCCYGKKPDQFHVRVASALYYEGGHIHEIERIEIHPEYNEISWDYDMGLLKLIEGIIFNDRAQPIELPKMGQTLESGTVLDIAGWGATELLGWPSDRINHNTIPTISQEDCKKVYAENSVTDRMFCVIDEGNGPCIGDTGSPGVSNGVLIGVASWSQSCAYKYPTAYTRLPEMVDWIIKVTQDSSSKAAKVNGILDTLLQQRIIDSFQYICNIVTRFPYL